MKDLVLESINKDYVMFELDIFRMLRDKERFC